jgi:hypothetical protein
MSKATGESKLLLLLLINLTDGGGGTLRVGAVNLSRRAKKWVSGILV